MSRGAQGGGAARGPGGGARRGSGGERGGGARGAPSRCPAPPQPSRRRAGHHLGRGVCVSVPARGQPWRPPGSASLRTHNKPTCARPPGAPLSAPHRREGVGRLADSGVLGIPTACSADRELRPAAGVGAQAPQQTHVRSTLGSRRLAGPGRAALRNLAIVSSRGGGSGARGATCRRRTTRDIEKVPLGRQTKLPD